MYFSNIARVAQLPDLGLFMSLGARPTFCLYIGLVIHVGEKLIRHNKPVQRYADGETFYSLYILSIIPNCHTNIVHVLQAVDLKPASLKASKYTS